MKVLGRYITSHIPVLSLLLSAVVAWLIFPLVTGIPMIAFFILFTGVSTLIYAVRSDKTWVDSAVYIGVLLLSFFLIYRANEFIQFFDFVFILFFIALLVRPLTNIDSILQIVLTPFIVLATALPSENIFIYKFTVPTFFKRKNYLKEYTPTILMTIVVLSITIPLLASANPLFNNLLGNVFKLLNLEWLRQFFMADSLVMYFYRGLCFLFFFYIIPRTLTLTVKGFKESTIHLTLPINYLMPKVALAGILVVFFITQLQLYFASSELLQSLGYTNSRLTNEVFAQVTIVAFVVLLLAYLDKSRAKWNTRVTYFLLLEAFFLIGIAFKSVYDYSSLYGFTQKRLWGYASMTWLTGALGAYVYHFYKKTTVQTYFKQMVGFSVAVIVVINLLNFDYLIYHTAKPSTQAGIDYRYIASRSVDAHYYTEVLPQLVRDIEVSNTLDDTKIQPALKIIGNIEKLRHKYGQKNEVNAFNIAEYQEYLATKAITIDTYKSIIIEKQLKLAPKVQESQAAPTPISEYAESAETLSVPNSSSSALQGR